MKKENFISLGICFSCGVRKQNGKDVIAWDTRARVDEAYMLYKQSYITKILCTGGIFQKGQKVPASKLMKDYLISLGVPASDVIIEDKSLDTIENIKFSFSLLKQQNFFKNLKNSEQLRLVIISERLHLRRIDVTTTAFLKKYKLDALVPLIFKPVHYHLSDDTKQKENRFLEETIKDPFGKGKIFEKMRKDRRQK